ncbi:MAG: hypothetical protein QNJ51_09020 [Calothrix sp. MO_167.B12]|nr:hypothetical protein [Calothrix sp. MO_167.B12]
MFGLNSYHKSSRKGAKTQRSLQSFHHARFVDMLVYKGTMKGITVIFSEESYTSKASFLSSDPIPNYGDEGAKQVKFSGYRETRGMYKIKGKKIRINADVNGSYNIMRKVIPTVFDGGIEQAARWVALPT